MKRKTSRTTSPSPQPPAPSPQPDFDREFRDFFYTPHDRNLFWVAGYTADNNTSNVLEKIEHLRRNAQKFADLVGVDISQVQTYYITDSDRYKSMRVFWITTDAPHPRAFIFGDYQHCGTKYHRNMFNVLSGR